MFESSLTTNEWQTYVWKHESDFKLLTHDKFIILQRYRLNNEDVWKNLDFSGLRRSSIKWGPVELWDMLQQIR